MAGGVVGMGVGDEAELPLPAGIQPEVQLREEYSPIENYLQITLVWEFLGTVASGITGGENGTPDENGTPAAAQDSISRGWVSSAIPRSIRRTQFLGEPFADLYCPGGMKSNPITIVVRCPVLGYNLSGAPTSEHEFTSFVQKG